LGQVSPFGLFLKTSGTMLKKPKFAFFQKKVWRKNAKKYGLGYLIVKQPDSL
jgi:hypothetical protein